MLKHRTKNHSVLPEPIAVFVEDVCRKQEQYNCSARPPHMLIPLDSGCGRSHITRIVANKYLEAKACSFSSRDILLEFTLRETIQRINEVDAELQSNSEYSNSDYFQGVIALNIDALLPHLCDVAGNRFFELVARIKNDATLIVLVPTDCAQKHIDLISEKIGASIKTFPAITYSDTDFTKFFYDFLPPTIIPSSTLSFDKHKERISAYISQNVRNKTIKNIKEAAEALFYNDEAKEMIFGKSGKNKESEVIKR